MGISPAAAALLWEETDCTFVPAEVYGRRAPFEVEIGVGKGRAVLGRAGAHPGIDFLAIEWAAEYAHLVAERAARRGLANLRVARVEARRFFEHHLPPDSVDRLHVYFPDPWPKRKQRKRRLLGTPFLRVLATRLRPAGEVLVLTDHEDYFRDLTLAFAAEPSFRAIAPPPPSEEGLTNYEIKYRREGRPIHRAAWERR